MNLSSRLFFFFFNKALLKIPMYSGCPRNKWSHFLQWRALAVCFLTSQHFLAWVSCSCVSISYMSVPGAVSHRLLILLDTNFICPVFWRMIGSTRSLLISQLLIDMERMANSHRNIRMMLGNLVSRHATLQFCQSVPDKRWLLAHDKWIRGL